MVGSTANTGNTALANAQNANLTARNAILTQAVDMWLPIFTQTYSSNIPGTVINVPVRNVGLLKRFVIEITGTFAQGASETQTLTTYGGANILSNVTFTDLSNQQRINTPGWHLHYVGTARRQAVFGGAFTNDSPTGVGSVFAVNKVPSSVTTAQAFRFFYEVPIAYGDYDLRGGIYMNVVNATANLQMTINPNFSVANTADATLAVYQSSTAQIGVCTAFTITVYQNFLDQLPMSKAGPVLPLYDLSTAYLLNQTSVGGIVAGQDNPFPYANFRNFMSTFLIYDQNGTLNIGTDVNYLSIQSANYTNIIKADPWLVKLWERQMINDDFPKGMYYIDTRRKPLSTIQYGNMQLILNPSSAASATAYLGYESLALINQITQAGSLYGS
jgi:hypothetical protein